MSESNSKRKDHTGGVPAAKRSKGGKAGRWSTPFQKAKLADQIGRGTVIAVGDEGIWVTCARGMKSKAAREFQEVCNEYGESMYGVKSPDDEEEDEAEGSLDIADSIQKELESLRSTKDKPRGAFSIVRTEIECIFFVKTMKPVEPKELVLKICRDAKECTSPVQRKLKYINRLTPVSDTGKASENGILKIARTVMAPHFSLNEEQEEEKAAETTSEEEKTTQPPAEQEETTKSTGEDGADAENAFSYAIRPTLRSYRTLKALEVKQRVAGIVQPKHKVNLTTPEKVVLIELFQNFCGVSVVDGAEWEELKRYNVNEMYRMAFEKEGEVADDKTDKEA